MQNPKIDFYEKREFPKKCECCGKVYIKNSWAYLPVCGIQYGPRGERWEMRNCIICRTTMMVRIRGERDA